MRFVLVSELGLNLGFSLLIPFLTPHLRQLALPGATVGLLLGLRTLSQQGLFLVGGVLADRGGVRELVVTGCLLRAVAFAAFGLSHRLPVLVGASLLAGLAAALFTPALKALLAAGAQADRPRAFALAAVLAQVGTLLGPLLGLLVLRAGFPALALTSAGLFLAWGVAAGWVLPARVHGAREAQGRWWEGLGVVARSRTFLAFCGAMGAYAVLFNQLHLALPLTLASGATGPAGVALLFALSAALAVLFQLRLASWLKERWAPARAVARGLLLMGTAFVPMALHALRGAPERWLVPAALLSVALLTVGMMLAFPFAMHLVATLAGEGRMGVGYGLYSLVAGASGAVGNVLVGRAFDAGGGRAGAWLWLCLAGLGGLSGVAVGALGRQLAGAGGRP